MNALLASIAGWGLVPPPLRPYGPLDDVSWPALMSSVETHRLAGLLAACVGAGEVAVTEKQRGDVSARHQRSMLRVMALEGELLRTTRALDGAGLHYRLLKGCAAAYLTYPEPALRPYADIDLLVRGDQFAGVVSVLAGVGMTRPTPEIRPGFDRRFGKGATLRTPAGYGIDLHRTFVAGPLAVMTDPEALFEHEELVTIAGVPLPALAREERLLHACIHAALGDPEPRLISLRDIVESCCDPRLNIERFRGVAADWHANAVVSKAISMAFSLIDVSATNELRRWANSYQPSPRESRILRAYAGNDQRWRRQSIAALREVPGLRHKVEYARGLLASRGVQST